jgi:hypothetical protein
MASSILLREVDMSTNNGGHVVGNPRAQRSNSIAGEVRVTVKTGVKKPPKKSKPTKKR